MYISLVVSFLYKVYIVKDEESPPRYSFFLLTLSNRYRVEKEVTGTNNVRLIYFL